MSRTFQLFLIAALLCAVFANSSFAKEPKPEPSPSPSLSLEDLGFSKQETQSNPQVQAELNERSHKLQLHQWTGIATLGLMAATVIYSGDAKKTNTHQVLGGLTAAGYWTTFYLSASAPSPLEVEQKGYNIKIHKALRWVTAPLMVLTPIAGIVASVQTHNGQKATGLGKYKDTLGTLTAVTYGVQAGVMFFEF